MKWIVDCVACGKGIDLGENLHYQKVSGWERRREQGGTNAVYLRQVEEVFMCYTCMGEARRGITAGQTSLL